MAVKYIFVTGGVVSGLGKGITAASLGRLLKQRGLRVKVQKLDPYLNVDPGTMSPYQHGEVFVTDDGAETDLDLGHYERFIDENLTVHSSVSSGKVYWNVLNRERTGDYLGATVQIIPHITNEIKRNIYSLDTPDTDVAIVEIGGTVGDIESQPFLESIRQIAAERGRHNVMFLHVSLIVSIPGTGELKSKPTQHSAKELLSLGIQPDVIICRSDAPVPRDILEKISLFCNIPVENAIPNLTAPVLYEVPLMLEREGLACRPELPLGVMVETPAAARTADLLAQESDFFSIGTNDLTQYILAADRNAPEVKRLYTLFHPAILRELRDVIRAGRQAGIPVGLCGEAAADPELLPLLLAWGLEELSVSPALLLETRARIAGWTAAEAGAVERQVMALAGPEEIRAYYDAWPHN